MHIIIIHSMPLDVFFIANLAGPTVDSTMTLSILSSRDAGPNIAIALSFNVSYGPPSRINCERRNTPDAFHFVALLNNRNHRSYFVK